MAFAEHRRQYGDTSVIPTANFFYGLQPGEEIAVEIEEGKTLIIRFLTVGQVREDGTRTVFYELNGQPREVRLVDRAVEATLQRPLKADADDPNHIAAPMPGKVSTRRRQEGRQGEGRRSPPFYRGDEDGNGGLQSARRSDCRGARQDGRGGRGARSPHRAPVTFQNGAPESENGTRKTTPRTPRKTRDSCWRTQKLRTPACPILHCVDFCNLPMVVTGKRATAESSVS